MIAEKDNAIKMIQQENALINEFKVFHSLIYIHIFNLMILETKIRSNERIGK